MALLVAGGFVAGSAVTLGAVLLYGLKIQIRKDTNLETRGPKRVEGLRVEEGVMELFTVENEVISVPEELLASFCFWIGLYWKRLQTMGQLSLELQGGSDVIQEENVQ